MSNSGWLFEVAGRLKIRVTGATERDLAVVKGLVGTKPTPINSGYADITIRFVDDLMPNRLQFLGINQFGFTDDEFYLLNRITGKAEVKIPFDQIGETPEILCQRGVSVIPLFDEILKLTLLKYDLVSLHASTVEFQDRGITFIGWARGGKTSAALAFVEQGAKFVADDWVIVSPRTNVVTGISGKLSVSEYNIHNLKKLKKRIHLSGLVQLAIVRLGYSLLNKGAQVLSSSKLNKLAGWLNEKNRLSIHMVDLFEQDQVLSSTTADIFVLLSSHDTTEFNLTTLNCSEFLLSLVNASEFDLAKFTNAYQAFCFAFPNRQSQFIENRKELLRQLLMISLPGKKLWRLNHPYPLPIPEFITDMIMPGRLNS